MQTFSSSLSGSFLTLELKEERWIARRLGKASCLEKGLGQRDMLPGEAGKPPGLERGLVAWLCGCLFKSGIKDTAMQADGLDPVKIPSALCMKEFKGIPGAFWPCSCPQGKEFPTGEGMCLESCVRKRFGTGLQCSSIQNESQTYASVSFITSTRRNTPSFYNLNTHKRETFLLLLL